MHTVTGCQLAWQAGDPEKDWLAVRALLAKASSADLQTIAEDALYLKFLHKVKNYFYDYHMESFPFYRLQYTPTNILDVLKLGEKWNFLKKNFHHRYLELKEDQTY